MKLANILDIYNKWKHFDKFLSDSNKFIAEKRRARSKKTNM